MSVSLSHCCLPGLFSKQKTKWVIILLWRKRENALGTAMFFDRSLTFSCFFFIAIFSDSFVRQDTQPFHDSQIQWWICGSDDIPCWAFLQNKRRLFTCPRSYNNVKAWFQSLVQNWAGLIILPNNGTPYVRTEPPGLLLVVSKAALSREIKWEPHSQFIFFPVIMLKNANRKRWD